MYTHDEATKYVRRTSSNHPVASIFLSKPKQDAWIRSIWQHAYHTEVGISKKKSKKDNKIDVLSQLHGITYMLIESDMNVCW